MDALYRPQMSPLQLDRYFLKGLYFQLKDGYDRGRVSPDHFAPPQLEIGVVAAEQNPEHPLKWRFEVSLELPDLPNSDFPYQVETTLVGYFTMSDDCPPEHAEQLARVNGPAVLYSCAREIIAAVTGRSPYPKLLIPTVTFIQPGPAATNDELALAAGPKQLTEGAKEGNPLNLQA
jgi:preprotein translocase subunit SecB